jgi:DNA polymerase-3 subunit delta
MTYAALKADWKKGKTVPVYLFYGEEEFLRREALDLAVETFVPDVATQSFNYDQLYGSDVKVTDVLGCCASFPVMAERRLVVVREADKLFRSRSKEEKSEDPFRVYLAKPNFDTILILETAKPGAKNTHPWKDLFAKAETVEFSLLGDAATAKWLVDRAVHYGKRFDDEAATLLVSYGGADLRSLAGELEKLVAFVGEAKERIAIDDVKEVVGRSKSYNIFEFTKAIGMGDREQATSIALRLFADDSRAWYQTIPMIARYLEQLSVAREMLDGRSDQRAIAEALGLYGGAAYFAKEYMSAARRYSPQRLDAAHKALRRIERESRLSRTDERLLIQVLLAEIMP